MSFRVRSSNFMSSINSTSIMGDRINYDFRSPTTGDVLVWNDSTWIPGAGGADERGTLILDVVFIYPLY